MNARLGLDQPEGQSRSLRHRPQLLLQVLSQEQDSDLPLPKNSSAKAPRPQLYPKRTLVLVNVMVEGLVRSNQTSYVESLPFGMDFYAETESKGGDWNNGVANLVSQIDWILLFELIVQTAMRNTEHCLRLQAVSILNVIVMKSSLLWRGKCFVGHWCLK